MFRRLTALVCLCIAYAPGLRGAEPEPAPRPATRPRTTSAPDRGLAWLAEQQNADGSWGDEQQPLLTALVLRAQFLHGDYPDFPRHGAASRKGLDWLIAYAKAHEGRLTADPKFAGESRFEHAVGTCALAESILSKDAPANAALRDALQQIIQTQNNDGGWSAAEKPSGDDFRLTAWNLIALHAARLANVKWFAMENARTNGARWLATHALPDGQYGYTAAQLPAGAITAGARSLGPCVEARLGFGAQHQDIFQTIDWMLKDLEKRSPWKYDAGDVDLEALAGAQEAMVFYGGSAWSRWNRALSDPVVAAQSPDGSWPPPGGSQPGLQSAKTKSGAIYRTAWGVRLCEPTRRHPIQPWDSR